MKKEFKIFKKQAGITLFMAVSIMAVLLFISFVVINIAIKSTLFASSGKDSQYAFYAADAGIECAMYWDRQPLSKFDVSTPGGSITCAGSTINTGSPIEGTTTVALIGGGGAATPSEVVWVEDQSSIPGVTLGEESPDSWSTAWISSNPAPFSGSQAIRSAISTGQHQLFFTNHPSPLAVNSGDFLFAYVYIDPANIPQQIMLQWNSGSWEHRAYWGSDIIGWGVNGTDSRRYMGPLPPAGQWARLQVPASQVGLEGATLNGMAFTLYGGRVSFDRAGKVSYFASGTSNPTSIFGFTMDDYGQNPMPSCAIVTVTKNPGGTTYIKSRGYNTCDTSNGRRVERGVEVTY